jgi:Na+-transporting methylmalonyl-CoA/oxaloacetate decarboxylase gamma subunit
LNVFEQGLFISLLGIGITFLALAALIVLIHILHLVFGSRTIMERDAPITTTMEIATDDRAIAIAAAWWYIQQKNRGSLGKRLEDTPGGWWNSPSKK